MIRRVRRAALAAAVLGTAVACGGDKAMGPVAGALKVVLTKPAGVDGAIMFQLAGPAAPATPVAGAGLAFWGSPFSGANSVKVVLTGPLTSGQTLLTFNVDDVNKASQYSATILQLAADTTTFALRNVSLSSGYALSVTK